MTSHSDMNEAPISVEFLECDCGWIFFSVKAGTQSIKVSASQVFDPFPDLLSWLEALSVGVQECAFTMDEEGHELVFRYIEGYVDYRSSTFTISEPSCYENSRCYIRTYVDRLQLIKVFYDSVTHFANSTGYKPEQWECDNIRWRLLELLKNWNCERIVETLTSLTAKQLRHFLIFVSANKFNISEHNAQQVEGYLNDPKTLEHFSIPAEETNSWCIEDKFGAMNNEQRRIFVSECLEENIVTWDGYPMKKWHSEIIEKRFQCSSPSSLS